MQNRQFEGGTGDDGANCSESLMGDGERHAGIKPFPAVRDNPKMRKKEFLNIGRVESGDFLFSERLRPDTRYRERPSASGLGFSSPSDFDSVRLAGCPAPSCSACLFSSAMRIWVMREWH